MSSCTETPPLKVIYAYLTEGCNLLCRHCWLAPRHDPSGTARRSLDIDLLASVLRQGVPLGLRTVKLTGGEPLLHPRIRELLDVVRESGLRLSMETNATLATPALARDIASCRRGAVSVSLDGPDAASHEYVRGVAGSFEAALAGIRALAAAGLAPQIIMTVMRHNHQAIEAVVRLAEGLGARSVKLNLVQPASRGEGMHQRGETLSVTELVNLGRYVENELQKTTALPLHYSYPLAFRALGRLFGEEGDCSSCGVLGILGLLPDGSYALCGVGEVLPQLVFGHALRDPLEAVWRDDATLNDLRHGMPRAFTGICGRCVMKNVCQGGCLAQNYYSSRDLWAPYWFCRQAEEAGIFPATRLVPSLAAAAASPSP